jgi:hypothetical protein
MKDPSRWVELSSDQFERDLLQSSRGDVPTERAYQRTLTSLGVGFLMPMAAAQVAEGATHAAAAAVAAPAKSLGAAMLVKWLGSGVLLGAVTASGIGLSSRVWRQEAASGSPVASVAPRVQAPPPVVVAKRAAAVPASSNAAEPPAIPQAVGRRSVRVMGPVVTAPVLPALAEPLPEAHSIEPKPMDASSIEREVRLLDVARRALARNATAEALTTLRRYASEFEHGALAPEARVLEVRALLQAGERGRANALGARIIASDPQSQHAEAARVLLGRASNP